MFARAWPTLPSRQIRLVSLAIAASIVTSIFTRTSSNLLKLPSRASKAVGDPSRCQLQQQYYSAMYSSAPFCRVVAGALKCTPPSVQSILARFLIFRHLVGSKGRISVHRRSRTGGLARIPPFDSTPSSTLWALIIHNFANQTCTVSRGDRQGFFRQPHG